MIKKTLTVTPRLGLHARPAGRLVGVAASFKSEVMVCKEGVEINGKSIMQMLTLGAECGAQITVRVSGPDEAEALAAIEMLLAAYREFADEEAAESAFEERRRRKAERR
ncbi:MAG: HPr family phosphocarrier protein [Elusimicrobia bacterium]|nr:HPr family phosphocarrier protein [Elusimicrobiota bacterium]